eukprot:g6794.t1
MRLVSKVVGGVFASSSAMGTKLKPQHQRDKTPQPYLRRSPPAVPEGRLARAWNQAAEYLGATAGFSTSNGKRDREEDPLSSLGSTEPTSGDGGTPAYFSEHGMSNLVNVDPRPIEHGKKHITDSTTSLPAPAPSGHHSEDEHHAKDGDMDVDGEAWTPRLREASVTTDRTGDLAMGDHASAGGSGAQCGDGSVDEPSPGTEHLHAPSLSHVGLFPVSTMAPPSQVAQHNDHNPANWYTYSGGYPAGGRSGVALGTEIGEFECVGMPIPMPGCTGAHAAHLNMGSSAPGFGILNAGSRHHGQQVVPPGEVDHDERFDAVVSLGIPPELMFLNNPRKSDRMDDGTGNPDEEGGPPDLLNNPELQKLLEEHERLDVPSKCYLTGLDIVPPSEHEHKRRKWSCDVASGVEMLSGSCSYEVAVDLGWTLLEVLSGFLKKEQAALTDGSVGSLVEQLQQLPQQLVLNERPLGSAYVPTTSQSGGASTSAKPFDPLALGITQQFSRSASGPHSGGPSSAIGTPQRPQSGQLLAHSVPNLLSNATAQLQQLQQQSQILQVQNSLSPPSISTSTNSSAISISATQLSQQLNSLVTIDKLTKRSREISELFADPNQMNELFFADLFPDLLDERPSDVKEFYDALEQINSRQLQITLSPELILAQIVFLKASFVRLRVEGVDNTSSQCTTRGLSSMQTQTGTASVGCTSHGGFLSNCVQSAIQTPGGATTVTASGRRMAVRRRPTGSFCRPDESSRASKAHSRRDPSEHDHHPPQARDYGDARNYVSTDFLGHGPPVQRERDAQQEQAGGDNRDAQQGQGQNREASGGPGAGANSPVASVRVVQAVEAGEQQRLSQSLLAATRDQQPLEPQEKIHALRGRTFESSDPHNSDDADLADVTTDVVMRMEEQVASSAPSQQFSHPSEQPQQRPSLLGFQKPPPLPQTQSHATSRAWDSDGRGVILGERSGGGSNVELASAAGGMQILQQGPGPHTPQIMMQPHSPNSAAASSYGAPPSSYAGASYGGGGGSSHGGASSCASWQQSCPDRTLLETILRRLGTAANDGVGAQAKMRSSEAKWWNLATGTLESAEGTANLGSPDVWTVGWQAFSENVAKMMLEVRGREVRPETKFANQLPEIKKLLQARAKTLGADEDWVLHLTLRQLAEKPGQGERRCGDLVKTLEALPPPSAKGKTTFMAGC